MVRVFEALSAMLMTRNKKKEEVEEEGEEAGHVAEGGRDRGVLGHDDKPLVD